MTETETISRRRAHMPAGSNHILNSRTLQTAHRRLAELLQPGLNVLDVGCGAGAITRGVAEAVTPHGRVVGLDINPDLIAEARQTHRDWPNLSFAAGDVFSLPATGSFDVVTAARVLQWLANPTDALRRLVGALKPGGCAIILDYNHEKIAWQPDPPLSVQTFYRAFLRWRSDAGMDNAIADHLVDMFAAVGLAEIKVVPQPEITQRGDPDFEIHISIWQKVAATRGHQIVADGYLTEARRAQTEADFGLWIHAQAQSQTMYLLAVEGLKPDLI